MTKEKTLIMLKLSEYQLAAVQFIAESFLRERIGQYWDIAEDLSGEGAGFRYNKEDPDNHAKFDAYINRRNDAEKVFNAAFAAAKTNHLKTEDVLLAEDIYETVRYERWLNRKEPKPYWTVDSRKPLHWGSEPLPVCEIEADSCHLKITGRQLILLLYMADCFTAERSGDFSSLARDLVTEGRGKEKASADQNDPDYLNVKMLFERGYRETGANGCRTEWQNRAEEIRVLCTEKTGGNQ